MRRITVRRIDDDASKISIALLCALPSPPEAPDASDASEESAEADSDADDAEDDSLDSPCANVTGAHTTQHTTANKKARKPLARTDEDNACINLRPFPTVVNVTKQSKRNASPTQASLPICFKHEEDRQSQARQ